MKISFDLDDTLIPGIKKFDTEKQTLLQRVLGVEKIRLGTIELFKELRGRGDEIFIYTTSLRSLSKIKFTFYSYGISVDEAINQSQHDKRLKATNVTASKYPPAFDIDVHVDDSPGLRMEGEKFNFNTIIVEEKDKDWVKKILEEL